jgi:hypothetical protein
MDARDAALRLNASLDEVAAALAVPDADALLAAESGLAAVLAGVTGHILASGDRTGLAAEITRARATLARCRVLGASLADAARLALGAQGRAADYRRSGELTEAAHDTRGRGLRTRL